MAKIRAMRKEDETTAAAAAATQPVNIGDRAFDNLRFIRETMERSTAFTAVPGYGGAFMGLTAIAASVIAAMQTSARAWLFVWLTEAALAFAIGLFAVWQKSKIANTSLASAPARKFALGFLPPLLCGVILTLGLWQRENFEMMVPVWLLLYGGAVVTGGAFSVKIVPVMGWCFIALGAVAFLLPADYGNWLMLGGFGVLHIIFGIVIARKFGG